MLLSTLLLPLWFQAAAQPPRPAVPPAPDHHLVKVRVRDAETLEKVLSLDLDLAACQALELPVRQLDVIAEDWEIDKIRAAGLDFEVVIRNLEDEIEKRLSQHLFPQTLTPPVGQGGMGGHYTLAQIIAILDKFAKDHPKICASKVSLGKSVEGRDIWMVKISDNVNSDENEPEVLYDALHHAREPLSATTTLQFMDWLLDNYGKDTQATFLVDNREMFFVPCVNPDGYEYNRSIRPGGGGMWRKNRRNNGGGTFGVDLNRNWTTGWSAPFGGNSTNPSSEVYRGPSALSEPETKTLDNFIKSRNFVLGNSCHTYTEILLHPWGYQRGSPPNVADYNKINAAVLAQNPMRAGPASTSLYIAAGTALDHYHAAHGMYGYSPELGLSSEGGFWPSPQNQVAIANRHQFMFRMFAMVAGANVAIDSATLTEATGGNNNGRVDPGEAGEVRVVVSNNGASQTMTGVVGTLKTLTPGVTITRPSHDFGKIAKFSSADNNGAPLLLFVASSFQGLVAKVELAVTFEGITVKKQLDLPFTSPRDIVATDFERDLGFRRSTADTARTGLFERAAPQQTSSGGRIYQPGSDHTPGSGRLCWVTGATAGTSVGSNDVDGGKTTCLSPVIDLSHVALPTLSIWLYYSESVNPGDPFTIEMSDNGGQSWSEIYRRNTSTPAWQQVQVELPGQMTGTMQFRFSAQDLSASLVEACVDDLSFKGIVETAALTLLGGAQRGSSVRMALAGENNALGLLLFSTGTGKHTVPGIEGDLLLSLNGLGVVPALSYGTSDRITVDLPIPQDGGLAGLRLYWQQLLIQGSTLKLGNRSSFQIQ